MNVNFTKTSAFHQYRSQSTKEYYSANIYTDDFLIYQINRYTSAKAVNSKLPVNNCQSQPWNLTVNGLTKITTLIKIKTAITKL